MSAVQPSMPCVGTMRFGEATLWLLVNCNLDQRTVRNVREMAETLRKDVTHTPEEIDAAVAVFEQRVSRVRS